ncbi:MAG: hypothetical protein A2Y17_11070 [Clostridiales bacterium GWF2_38_85]|nr:MAG: hypothetical protein A2Y17_11070 [Clostridiales bacterium GWF2_38_85]HBL84667.1 LD-carboxypeptidase [Clostridiales bacterium]
MSNIIKPDRLQKGDTIGIIAPSFALKPKYIQNSIMTLQQLGFQIKLSKHLFSDKNGYAGSVDERTDDFNTMIADNSVEMLLFGGGEVCNEILPYIDYENIKQHPKIICSYSDSTTILNAVHSKTGLITFYGASLRTFDNLTDYNRQSFEKRLMTTDTDYFNNSEWRTIHEGDCEGVLTGGYLVNYASLQGSTYFDLDKSKKYLLFIEDHEMFSSPAVVSKWFSNLEQRNVFKYVTGLVFGHYSKEEQPLIDEILHRLGERYRIPVVRCEDFGHGINNAIWPIGISATLDTASGKFEFTESGVV